MSGVQEKIEALIEQARAGGRAGGISKTRAVFNQLERVEEALSLGVKRQAIAESFGWTLGEFEGAYRRALQLRSREVAEKKTKSQTSEQPLRSARSAGIGKKTLAGEL